MGRIGIRQAALAVVIAFGACAQDPEQPAVHAALDATIQALEQADWARLWALSAPDAQTEVLDLYQTIAAGLARVDEVYEEGPARLEARRALGAALVEGLAPGQADLGPQLLARLLDASAIRLDEDARSGLLSRRATFDGDRAVIHTAAGEAFTFVRTPEGWRARLVTDILRSARRTAELAENSRAVIEAAERKREAWRALRDPREPQGAYNVARAAVDARPPDVATLFAVVDDAARAALVSALETARELQRNIQRRTARKQREDAYEKAGIAMHVAADSDKALLEAWSRTDGFVPPVVASDPPRAVEGDVAAGRATVVTDGGREVPVARDASGIWHVGGWAPAITAALETPVREAAQALEGGGEAAPPAP